MMKILSETSNKSKTMAKITIRALVLQCGMCVACTSDRHVQPFPLLVAEAIGARVVICTKTTNIIMACYA